MGSWEWGPQGGDAGASALTCRDGKLGVDLVHKHLSAGLDHNDLRAGGTWVSQAGARALSMSPGATYCACENLPAGHRLR